MSQELTDETRSFPELRIRSRSSGITLAILEIAREDGFQVDYVITSETERIRVGKGPPCDIGFSDVRLAYHQFRIDLVRSESAPPKSC